MSQFRSVSEDSCRRLRFDWEELDAGVRLSARPAWFPNGEIPLQSVTRFRTSDLFLTMTFAFCIRGLLRNDHTIQVRPVCLQHCEANWDSWRDRHLSG